MHLLIVLYSLQPMPLLFAHSPTGVAVKLNGNRHITGILRGFDQFMNLVLDETVEQALTRLRQPVATSCCELRLMSCSTHALVWPMRLRHDVQVSASEKNNIGMVVIRGNSIVMMEALEKLWGEIPGGGAPPR